MAGTNGDVAILTLNDHEFNVAGGVSFNEHLSEWMYEEKPGSKRPIVTQGREVRKITGLQLEVGSDDEDIARIQAFWEGGCPTPEGNLFIGIGCRQTLYTVRPSGSLIMDSREGIVTIDLTIVTRTAAA